MKKIILIALAFLAYSPLSAQFDVQCLPEGFTFSTQAEIDSFPIYYPTCTTIKGDVEIVGDDITNLNGLNGLTRFGGKLSFRYADSLANLTGLENVTSIGGTLYIYTNYALTSLSGLDNLTSIGGELFIRENGALSSLTGLENLNSIGERIWIDWNVSLLNLEGLDNLTDIGGVFRISENVNLNSLTGLESLDASSISVLNIFGNPSLTSCEIQSLCEYLTSPDGSVNIYDNASGCNNPPEVADACEITLPCLPYGNYHFRTQSDIDNFQTNYPNCTEIEGSIIIRGDFTNLNGLNVITSIGGSLKLDYISELTSLSGLDNVTTIGGGINLYHNDLLTDFTGLENLTSIGDYLWLRRNGSLTNFQGLNNLDSIGGNFTIGGHPTLENLSGLGKLSHIDGSLIINGWSMPGQQGNISLVSLNGLDNLSIIGGDLEIMNNDTLSGLTGLNNLSSIGGDLSIRGNDLLSECDVQSVCNYLVNPNGSISISNNAIGCNSQEEVEEACGITSIEEALQSEKLLVCPNPFSTSTTIEYEFQQATTVQITIFNHLGKQIELIRQNQSAGKQQFIWNAEDLPSGMYFCVLKTDSGTKTMKMIKL